MFGKSHGVMVGKGKVQIERRQNQGKEGMANCAIRDMELISVRGERKLQKRLTGMWGAKCLWEEKGTSGGDHSNREKQEGGRQGKKCTKELQDVTEWWGLYGSASSKSRRMGLQQTGSGGGKKGCSRKRMNRSQGPMEWG